MDNKNSEQTEKRVHPFRMNPLLHPTKSLFLDVRAIAKRLICRPPATTKECPLLNDHTPIGKHNSYMPAYTQRATFDNLYDHLWFYRYNSSFHSCLLFRFHFLVNSRQSPFVYPSENNRGAGFLSYASIYTSVLLSRLE